MELIDKFDYYYGQQQHRDLFASLYNRRNEEEGISTVNEEDHYVYTETFGAVAPRFSGSLSFFASGLIIYVIFRSSARLSTVYHRIMFGMSIADMLGSLAMALTTIPMPRPDISEVVDSYEFEGSRYGNTGTCTAQGFFFMLGELGTYLYNGTLCFYYACAIAFTMHESNIKKKVEPLLHLIPVGLGIGIATYSIFTEMYNPTPGSSWCTIRNLDYKCTNDCERGGEGIKLVLFLTLLIMVIDFVVILTCLSLVCRKVYLQNKMLVEYQDRADTGTSDFIRNLTSRNHYTRVVMIQSLSYIAALCTTLLFPTLILFNFSDGEIEGNHHLLTKLQLIFSPLQGFFNLLIFVFSKVATLRYNDPDMSVRDAFRKLFGRKRYAEHIIVITGINFIQGEDGNMEPELNEAEINSSPTSGWSDFVSQPSIDKDSAFVSRLSRVSTKDEAVPVNNNETITGKKVVKRRANMKRKLHSDKNPIEKNDPSVLTSDKMNTSFHLEEGKIDPKILSENSDISFITDDKNPPIANDNIVKKKKIIRRRGNDKTKNEITTAGFFDNPQPENDLSGPPILNTSTEQITTKNMGSMIYDSPSHDQSMLSQQSLSSFAELEDSNPPHKYESRNAERTTQIISSLRKPKSSSTGVPSQKSSVSFARDGEDGMSLSVTSNTSWWARSRKRNPIKSDDNSSMS